MVGALAISAASVTDSAAAASTKSDNKLKFACQAFAGELFSQMLKEMRKTVPEDKLLGDQGHEQEIFTEMMDNKVAQDMSKQGGSNGLGDQLYNQLSGRRAYSAAAAPAVASSTLSVLAGAEAVAPPSTPEEDK